MLINLIVPYHFRHEQKINLYKKIFSSLNPNGLYIECDYIAKDQREEDFYFAELDRFRKEQNIPENEFVHYDTPCTPENQIKMFKEAGFRSSKKVWKMEATVIIINRKDD